MSEMEADAETAAFGNRITTVVSRLTETESLIKAFDGCDGVFHTAAFVDPAGISGYSVCFSFFILQYTVHQITYNKRMPSLFIRYVDTYANTYDNIT